MAIFLFWRVGEDVEPWKAYVGLGVVVVLAGLLTLAIGGQLSPPALDLHSVVGVLSLLLWGVGGATLIAGILLKWRDTEDDPDPVSME